jgi:hypothetical protein
MILFILMVMAILERFYGGKMLKGDSDNNFDDLISRNFCRFADECADLQQLLPTESGSMFDIYTRRVVDFSSDKNLAVFLF